ncbi:PTS system EIIC component [Peptoanaerobacter stomatis]|jgi:regulatory protein (pfos/r)|uniref:PTS system EIIC component n=1 Tax=Peptoanaerobacter stomatis TaxID=796937 RepID=J4WH56_9FIRM|nr:PTS sugar transporter subunit IIC [Peptoanaerobacter stomatis]EJU24496.1 PTS system EIIC component [Peptoanaerobacter stomatis]NWO25954.1 PTS sugar transporter subunit IIC [Peptostreptococcaceae bacterium oral taxon 081]
MKIKDYFIKTLNGMALGLFSSLIIGLILKQLGEILNNQMLILFGKTAQLMMAPAIGVGVAYSLSCPPLVIFASVVTGIFGGGSIKFVDNSAVLSIGEPVGAFVSSLVACEVGKRINGKTKVDIVVVPAITIISGAITGMFISPAVSTLMSTLGMIINTATTLQPILMGIVLSVIMGIILTLPISSAAISISLGLSGLAAGASLVGCCCNMIGFAVISYRENKIGGLISQGIGTSMIQIPNIIKNPKIWIPVIISSAILGPISTTVLKMECDSIGAGMGTSGLVGQVSTLTVMGKQAMIPIIIMHFILPALISLIISEYMRKKGYIKYGDMKL